MPENRAFLHNLCLYQNYFLNRKSLGNKEAKKILQATDTCRRAYRWLVSQVPTETETQ